MPSPRRTCSDRSLIFPSLNSTRKSPAPRSDELYGFERLEHSLRRHRNGSAAELKRGLLSDLDDYTGGSERDDDLTLLVLRLPEAEADAEAGG